MATTVSVVGEGKSDRRNTNALIRDFTDGFAAETAFLIPVTEPWFTDAVRHVADWVYENRSTFVAITFLADSHDMVDLSDFPDAMVTEVDDMATALAEADQVIVAWQDDPDFESWVEDVLKSGKKVLDLTDGLYPIEYTPDADQPAVVAEDPTPVAEPVPTEPKPAAKPRRSRAAANAEKAKEKAATEQPADEGQALVPEQVVSWPPAGGEVVNTPEFFEAMAGEIERRVVERLRSALA